MKNTSTTNYCPNCEAMAKENERLREALKECAEDYRFHSEESREEQLESLLDSRINVAKEALGEE